VIDGTMPTVKIFSALPRVLAGVAVALAAGCATSVPGEAAPRSDPPSSQAAPSPGPGNSGSGCQVRVSSGGSISSSGAGGRTVTTNGRTSFSCADGPLIGIDAFDTSGVTFSADGRSATVAPGSSATVGAYRISVTRADAVTAEFQVEPNG
jgi:hypothetical protein